MKITIQRNTLLERLTHVSKAVSSRVVIPIMEGVLIESESNLTLTCADSSFTITTSLDQYEELEAGQAVIPAKKLLDVLRKMPDKPINIEVEGTTALIKCGSTKVKLPVMDAEEFPRKIFPQSTMADIDGDDFARLVDATKFAVSTNEQTPILQGLNISVTGDTLTATATDRHRLSRQSINLDEGELENGQYIVPVKALETVSQLKPETIELGFNDSSIFLRAGSFQYISSLMDGTYPDTSRIIPTSGQITVLIDTKRLLQTLELAEKIAEEKTKIVRFDISEGELFVSVKDSDAAMEESIEAIVTGGELKLSMNARYLIDALKCITSNRTEIWFSGSMSPVILHGEGVSSGLHLVLPYRTQGS